ncbi:MAG: non-heme iron oxygenase ferredoxin subunit [Acidimicrobiales bacterium]
MSRHELFPMAELASGSARRVEVGGHEIAVVRIGDDLYAIGDTCSHAEVSLSEGWVEPDERASECVRHGATFDLRTGEPTSLPATRPVPVYRVELVDGRVVLYLDDTGGTGGTVGAS